MKILNVVGARPQFIKYMPISEAIRDLKERSGHEMEEILVHTGQHYDYSMSRIFFDQFGIRQPDYHLGVGSGTHGKQTGEIMAGCEEAFLKELPDVVIVYGDTNSTVGAALAASKLDIPVAHVEAGLRSFNKYMPEEINRVVTDHVSTYLFCPGTAAVGNLAKEGFLNALNGGALVGDDFFQARSEMAATDKDNPVVVNVGDVMFDALGRSLAIARRLDVLGGLDLKEKDYCLLTVHRAENTASREEFDGLMEFVEKAAQGRQVIFPVHPRTRRLFGEYAAAKASRVIRPIEPVGHFELIALIKGSSLVLTDSGGIQKEAFWLEAPCVTLRDRTEWVETVESGWNVLYRQYDGRHDLSSDGRFCYGDGRASEKIASCLAQAGGLLKGRRVGKGK